MRELALACCVHIHLLGRSVVCIPSAWQATMSQWLHSNDDNSLQGLQVLSQLLQQQQQCHCL